MRSYFLICLIVILAGCKSDKEVSGDNKLPEDNKVILTGAMKNVMWKGEISGIIDIDTISNKENLYGLGPAEYLSGEIMIINGKGYRSEVTDSTNMKVTETLKLKAPFFGYANVKNWKETNLPDSVISIPQLEKYLELNTQKIEQPFFFRIKGTVDSAEIHIVNLPEGSKVSSPEEAHQGQINFDIQNEPVELLGFFSTEHKSIFTHHDTFVHIHLITDNKKQMGHLENLALKPGEIKLYLPVQ